MALQTMHINGQWVQDTAFCLIVKAICSPKTSQEPSCASFRQNLQEQGYQQLRNAMPPQPRQNICNEALESRCNSSPVRLTPPCIEPYLFSMIERGMELVFCRMGTRRSTIAAAKGPRSSGFNITANSPAATESMRQKDAPPEIENTMPCKRNAP